MIESLIYLVVYIVVLGIVLWLLIYLIDNVPMPAPFGQIARTVVIVIGALLLILLLLQFVGGLNVRLH